MPTIEELEVILKVLETSVPIDDPIALAHWKLSKIIVNRWIRGIRLGI